MEVNFSMKEMLLILKADRSTKSTNIDKSSTESPFKYKNSEVASSPNKNTLRRANQPSSKATGPSSSKQ